MKTGEDIVRSFIAIIVGVSLTIVSFAPAAFAGKEIAEGLSLFGDMRFRAEMDTDDTKDKDRTRERIRARIGVKYVANSNVTMGIRLETETDSIQSPHSTLSLADSQTHGLGVGQAYLAISGGPATLLLGKWGSPLFNLAEYVHDADINFEGIGASVGFNLGGVNLTAILAHHIIKEKNWVGTDDDTLLTGQLIASGGDGISWKAAVGFNTFTTQVIDPGDTEHTVPHVLAEVRIKEMSDLRIGGAYSTYSGDGDFESEDEDGVMVFIRGKVGPVGLRLYYWDVGFASQLLFGQAGQDNFPFSSNFTGYHFQVDLPKLFNTVSWDLRYYSQDTKNENLSFGEDGAPGYVITGADRTRTRLQINLNVKF